MCAALRLQAPNCNGQKVNDCSKNSGKSFERSQPPMGSSPSQQKIYRDAVAGIPRVVQAISDLPSKHHAEALAAAGRGYRQTILESGIAEPTADRMVATLLRRLQNRLAKERSVKDKVMRALHEELIHPAGAGEQRRPPKKRTPRRRSSKQPPQTESPPVQDKVSTPLQDEGASPVEDGLDAESDADLAPIKKSPTTSPE